MALISDPDGLSQGGVTTPGDVTISSASGATAVLNDGTGGLPVVSAGDYIELRDMANAENNGLYLVTGTPTTSAIDITKQSLTGSVTNPSNEAVANASARVFGSSTDVKNIYIDTTNLLISFLNGFGSVTTLDNEGVTGQALYSFLKEEWRNDDDLIKFEFPMTAITPEQFEFNTWLPVDESQSTISTSDPSNTRELIRSAGWDEVDANGFIIDQYFCWLTLGNIDSGDNAYSFWDSADSAADIITAVFDGPVNEGVRSVERVDLSGAGTISFGTTTLTRATGSFITDGFKVGDYVFVQNAEDSANNGSLEITAVTATELTVTGGTYTTNSDDTTALVAIDRRPIGFTCRIRVFGKTYDESTTSDIGVSTITNQVYRFPLSEATDAVISDLGVSLSDAAGAASPYDDMNITYFATGQSRSGFNDVGGDAGVTNFSIIVDGDVSEAQQDGGGAASAEQIYAFVQAQLAGTTDIDQNANGVIGQLAEELLAIASTGNTLSSIQQTANLAGGGTGVYVDSFAGADKNRVQFVDDDGDLRAFPLTVVLTLEFNSNLTNDANAVFTMFFTNDDAGDDAGADFGTIDAIIVDTDTGVDITGAIPGSSQTYNYAYDENVQRGAASSGTDAPVTIVAIGLDTAQYVIATGTITSSGLTASLVAALERNFSNP